MFVGVIIVCIICAIKVGTIYYSYSKSVYKIISNNSFSEVLLNIGIRGEFYTVKEIEETKQSGKILVNTYLKKKDGTTTEIDIIFITEYGIFVLESKNYSGWIFGNEKQAQWTQCLKNKQKNKFYNPIWQNQTHIKQLEKHLNIGIEKFKSIIVFSERCELKKITMANKKIKVIKRNSLSYEIKRQISEGQKIISPKEVETIFNYLYLCSNVSEITKQKHIDDLKARI